MSLARRPEKVKSRERTLRARSVSGNGLLDEDERAAVRMFPGFSEQSFSSLVRHPERMKSAMLGKAVRFAQEPRSGGSK